MWYNTIKPKKVRYENLRKYIGAKIIDARLMTSGDYNNYRRWQIPEDENPEDKGYLVRYNDGYRSWTPIYVFEDYRERFKTKYKRPKIRINGLKETR